MKRKRGIIGRLLAAAMAAVLLVSSMPANVYAEEKEDVSLNEYLSSEETLEESEAEEISDSEEILMLATEETLSGEVFASELTDGCKYRLTGDTTIIIQENDNKKLGNIRVLSNQQYCLTFKGSNKGKLTFTDNICNNASYSFSDNTPLKIEGGTIECSNLSSASDIIISGGRLKAQIIEAREGASIEIQGGYIECSNGITSLGSTLFGKNVTITGGEVYSYCRIDTAYKDYGPAAIEATDTLSITGGFVYGETTYSAEYDSDVTYGMRAPKYIIKGGAYVTAKAPLTTYNTYSTAFADGTITTEGMAITDPTTNESVTISDDGTKLIDADGNVVKEVHFEPATITYAITTDKSDGVTFETTGQGDAAPFETITVSNSASGPVTLKNAFFKTGTSFEIKDFSETRLLPGGTFTFTVKPKELLPKGSYKDTLTITTDMDDVTAVIPLSYTVNQGVRKLQASPKTLDFGTYKRAYDGTYSVTDKIVTIKNTGTSTVTLDTTVTLDDYEITYPADTELAVDETAELTIKPKTGLAVGNHDAVLFFKTTNGLQESVSVKLNVVDHVYNITADKEELDFGRKTIGYENAPAEKTIKLSNKGTAVVTLIMPTSISFEISTTAEDLSIAPGKSIDLKIRPKIGLTHSQDEKLEISTLEGASSMVRLLFDAEYFLSGYVNASDLVDNARYVLAGDTTINIEAGDDKTIDSISDYSTYNLTIRGSNAGKLKTSGTTGISIFLGTNEDGEFEYKNKLIITGGTLDCSTLRSNGDLMILGGKIYAHQLDSDQGDIVISAGSVSLLREDLSCISGKNVIITGGELYCETSWGSSQQNTATIIADKSITFKGGYANVINKDDRPGLYSFALSSPEISIGEDAFITATTSNGSEAIYTDDLTVADGLKATDLVTGEAATVATDDSEYAGHLINTSGNLVTSVRFEKNDTTIDLTLSASEVDFGTMYEGFDLPPARKILVTNTGTAPAALPAVTFDTDDPHFTVGSYSDDYLLPGQSAYFTVQPKEALSADTSPYSETLSIDMTSVGGDKYTFTASVNVETGFYSFEVTPDSLDFGTFPKGYMASGVPAQTATITNTGNVPLEIDNDISKTKSEEPFVLDDLTTYCLAPGESTTVTVRIAEGADLYEYARLNDNNEYIIEKNADISFKCGETSANRMITLSCHIIDPNEDSIWIEAIPAQTYNGTALKPAVNAYYRGVKLSAKDYTVSYKNNTNAYTYASGDADFNPAKAPSVTVKGKGNYTGTVTEYFIITPLDLSQATAPDLTYAYTGKAQFGKTKVTYLLNGKSITLKENKDYSYVWESGKDYKAPGTYTTTITSKPGSNYVGINTYQETITEEGKILISTVKVPSIPDQKYTGKYKILFGMPVGVNEEPATAKNGKAFDFTLKNKAGKVLNYGTDYTLSIYNNKEIGTAVVTITGVGIYVGSRTVTFKITGTKLSSLKTEGFVKSVPYNGRLRPQAMRFYYVTGKGKNAVKHYLYEDIDYTAAYRNNIEIGTATVTYTGIGAYTGTVTKTYKITGTDIKKVTIPKNFGATTGKFGDIVYTDEQCYDTKKGNFIYTGGAFEVAGPANAESLADNYGIQLYSYDKKTDTRTYYRNGVDYIVTYKNNTDPGKATVTFTGIGRLSGSVSRTFNIAPYNIKDNKGNRINVELNGGPEFKYVKGGVQADCTVTYKGFDPETSSWFITPLKDCTNDKKGSGYARSYNKYTNMVSTANKKAAVIIKGKGSFTGTLAPIEYIINGADISTDATITATDIAWQEKSGICKPQINVMDINSGKVLKAGTDYKKAVKYTYKNATEVMVKGSAASVSRAAGDEVGTKDIVPKNTVITATVTGINNYSGTISTDFCFIDKDLDLSKAVITIKAQIYTGKEIRLKDSDISFKINGEEKTLTLGSDYEIVYDQSGYTKIGTYTVTIRAKNGNENGYGNQKTVTFKINAKSF